MNKSIDMKNKKIADASIFLLIILFLIFIGVKIIYKNNDWWFELIGFIIEASLVGAIADWFAITALFEKPIIVGKLPFISKHTAIIPSNRKSIVEAVAKMVQNELLSEKVLRSKINSINIVDKIIGFIEKNSNRESKIYIKVVNYLTSLIDSIDTNEVSKFIEMGLKGKIKDTDLSVYIEKGLLTLEKNKEFKKIVNSLLNQLIEIVNQDTFKVKLNIYVDELIESQVSGGVQKFFLNLFKMFNGVNSEEATESIIKELNKILNGLKNENDPMRIELIGNLKNSIENMNSDKFKKYIEEWKFDTLEKSSIHENINDIIEDVVKGLKIIVEEVLLGNNSLEKYNDSEKYMITKQDLLVVILWIKHKIEVNWNSFKDNSRIKEKIEFYIKEFIFKFIESKYETIGNVVKRVLNSMDDDSLNNFILKKAGNDLHAIRINGCTMGAIFGAAVFGTINIIYEIILPNIFNIRF